MPFTPCIRKTVKICAKKWLQTVNWALQTKSYSPTRALLFVDGQPYHRKFTKRNINQVIL